LDNRALFSLSLGWGPRPHYKFQHNSVTVKVYTVQSLQVYRRFSAYSYKAGQIQNHYVCFWAWKRRFEVLVRRASGPDVTSRPGPWPTKPLMRSSPNVWSPIAQLRRGLLNEQRFRVQTRQKFFFLKKKLTRQKFNNGLRLRRNRLWASRDDQKNIYVPGSTTQQSNIKINTFLQLSVNAKCHRNELDHQTVPAK
jgi:hypothetical protein